MPKKRTAFRNRLEALAAGAAGAALAKMTPEAAEAVGRGLGRPYLRLDGRRRNLARANLARAFPDLPSAGIDALTVRVFEHFGGLAAELLHAMGHGPADALSRIETEGAEVARAALASGRGVLFLTAHLGNWEWAAIGEIPSDRIDIAAYYDPRPATPGKMMTHWGGFLDQIDQFDASFFGISPREADRDRKSTRLNSSHLGIS